jgi:hypothetical protein
LLVQSVAVIPVSEIVTTEPLAKQIKRGIFTEKA